MWTLEAIYPLKLQPQFCRQGKAAEQDPWPTAVTGTLEAWRACMPREGLLALEPPGGTLPVLTHRSCQGSPSSAGGHCHHALCE